MTRHFFLTASVIALLSACDESGGSSGDIDVTSGDTGAIGGDDIVPEEVVSFAELQERANQLGLNDGSFFDGLELDADLDVTIPTTGSATYTGVVSLTGFTGFNDELVEPEFQDVRVLVQPDSFDAVGATTLTADFDNQSISGTADNFFQLDNLEVESFDDVTGQRIDGSLEYNLVQDTNDFGDGDFYVGNISGSISPINVAEIDIDQSISGEFIGENADRFIAASFETPVIVPNDDASFTPDDEGVDINIFASRD